MFPNNWAIISIEGGAEKYENDVSAEEQTEIESSWLQGENELPRGKKSLSCKKGKGKIQIVGII